MNFLPTARFKDTEIEQLNQVVHLLKFHWQTLYNATGWAQIPEPGYALSSILRTRGSIKALVPDGIMLDSSQLDHLATQKSRNPKKSSFVIHLHPVNQAFFLRIQRRDNYGDLSFTTVLATVDANGLAYWHGDPIKDSETISETDTFSRVSQIWERHSLKPFDPYNL